MKKIFDFIKGFLAIKILLTISAISLIVISVNYTLQSIKNNNIDNITKIEKLKQTKISDSISKPKKWDIDTLYLSELQFSKIKLRTKYVNGSLFYYFGIETKDKNDRRFINQTDQHLIIDFSDKDNFKVYSYEFPFSDATHISKNGEKIGYYWEGNLKIEKNLYYSFYSSSIRWDF
jgi:hypothetical protein